MSSSSEPLRNIDSTSARSDYPSRNFADWKRLALQSGAAFAYLYGGRPFPLGATIISATLRVYTYGSWNIAPTLTVRRIAGPWRTSQLTWDTRPGITGVSVTTTQSSAADAHEWAFDVTGPMQAVANGARWYGFRIETDSNALRFLYSSEAVRYTPVIDVTWSDAPQAPSTLSPSGGRAVSVAKPQLRFDFTDNAGSTSLQAVQVQIDPARNWTTPAFDSGAVAATEPELNLANTAYAGLSAGASTYWRVRVQDSAGGWSPWSDAASVRRDNKGALTVTNPAAAPNNFVSEWTPPISWSLTGETQTAWQVSVLAGDDNSTVLYDTGRTKGTATAHTLPKGVLFDSSTYTVRVRVWDSKDREATPGDPTWTQSTRDFTFAEDPTPNPPANLTAIVLDPTPWVELRWTRSTAPDSFSVVRDGRVQATGLIPVDHLVSGTTYHYIDRDAAPNRSHTWKVQAVANGKTSANNPAVTAKDQHGGVWVYDDERGIDLYLNGGLGSTWGSGEEGATYMPLGSRKPVRITQSVRGIEGRISDAAILDEAGKSANYWEAQLRRIKARPGRVVTLSYGDFSFPAILSDVVIRPWPENPNPEHKLVDFNFWQVGGFDEVRL